MTDPKGGAIRSAASAVLQALRWLVLSAAVAALAGSASAAFLWLLDRATDWRETHVWIIALLPLGGLAVGLVYHRFGKSVEGGNNLILDEIHDPRNVIPLRMTPLVLLGSVASHFFGASVGREGTAVQMGGSLADQLSRPLRSNPDDRRIILMAGMSAGFAAVFGTPVAGAVFGLEVLALGRLRRSAIFACFASALLADRVCLAWGIRHTPYAVASEPPETVVGLLSCLLAGALFGGVALLFTRCTRKISDFFKARISYAPLRPLAGGLILAPAVWALGSTRYIGLGIPAILESFTRTLPPWDFAAKLGFTALSLGSGFKGGEVTPLFFIGATLGSALSRVLPIPTDVLAGMGFVAVFAGAAKTPLASMLMAMELFGARMGIPAGLACVAAILSSGREGIYGTRRPAP